MILGLGRESVLDIRGANLVRNDGQKRSNDFDGTRYLTIQFLLLSTRPGIDVSRTTWFDLPVRLISQNPPIPPSFSS